MLTAALVLRTALADAPNGPTARLDLAVAQDAAETGRATATGLAGVVGGHRLALPVDDVVHLAGRLIGNVGEGATEAGEVPLMEGKAFWRGRLVISEIRQNQTGRLSAKS